MSDYERLGMEQEIADLRFALRQTLDQRDLLEVKVSQYQASRTLTDAELEAVRTAAFAYSQNDDDPKCAETAARLLAVAERLK